MKTFRSLKAFMSLLIVLLISGLAPAWAAAVSDTDGWSVEDGITRYYANGEMLYDCVEKIDGEWYGFQEDGSLLQEGETCFVSDGDGGLIQIRAGWDNILLSDEWVADPEDPDLRWYYGEDCAMACGPTRIGERVFLFDSDTGLLLYNQRVLIDGSWYRSDSYGILSEEEDEIPEPTDGWVTDADGSVRYLRDGQAVTGFQEMEDGIHFFYDDGRMAKGESIYLNQRWIRFDEDGCMIPDDPAPEDGWRTVNGERYYYRDGSPISRGHHVIEWKEYWFDADGRLLHDCIAEDYLLDADGLAVPEGPVRLNGYLYYVNKDTHRILRNASVSIDNVLYEADSSGHLKKTEDSSAENGKQGTENTETGDPDVGYVPRNEEDRTAQDEVVSAGTIRYSDDYLFDSQAPEPDADASDSAPGPGSDNPQAGMLAWREGAWIEIHGSPEDPIEIHVFGSNAAFMQTGILLRDVIFCSAEGVIGYDQYGRELPPGSVTRYGKQFVIADRENSGEQLLLLMS